MRMNWCISEVPVTSSFHWCCRKIGFFRVNSPLFSTKEVEEKKKERDLVCNGRKTSEIHYKEFALVLGLKTWKIPSNEKLRKVTKNHNLRDEVFSDGAKVTLEKLKNKFENVSSHTRSKEKLQIAFVYLLVGFLMAQDTKKIIDTFYFQLVSNLELFDNYTVGHMCYDLKLDYLKFDF